MNLAELIASLLAIITCITFLIFWFFENVVAGIISWFLIGVLIGMSIYKLTMTSTITVFVR